MKTITAERNRIRNRLIQRTGATPAGEDRNLLKRMKKMLILLTAVCMLLCSLPAAAETMHEEIGNDAVEMELFIGYDGAMTYGKVMPMRVMIRNFGDDFEGVLGINAYANTKEYDRYEKEVFLPAGSEREIRLPVTVYSRQKIFTAELVQDGRVVCAVNAEPSALINPSALMIGVLSTRPRNLKNLDIGRDNDVLARYEIWQTIPLTADTFPEEAGELNSFGMLVIDDIDPASLSQRQQEALGEWIRGGRILLCGGGAAAGRNTAFFGNDTGLKLEEVTTSDSILQGLEKLIGRSAGSKDTTAALAVYSGGKPLATDAEGRGLVYRTPVGNGRIYTAAFETGDSQLNRENLMGYFWQQLIVTRDQELYSTILYNSSDNYSSPAVNAAYALPVRAKSFLLPGMLVVLGMLVICCAAWWILKKKDRRQWMWIVLPAVSVLAVAAILLLSTGAETNKPMAVVSDNLVQTESGSIRNYSSISVASPDSGRHSYSLDGEKLHVQIYDYVDFDEEEEEKKREEPDSLRTCYTAGGENTVTAESLTPWSQVNLNAEFPSQIRGRIDGSVWMEEDGLHGEIVNETDTGFEPGYVVTSYGFVSVPALAPGEKASILMTRRTFTDPKNPVYEDGGLYAENPGLYSVANYATGYVDAYAKMSSEQALEKEIASSMINNAADVLRRNRGNWSYGSYESALFLYCARPANEAGRTLKVDGVPVDRQTGVAMMTADLPFTAVGRTGVVFRSAGTDIPDRVETDDNLMPTDTKTQSGKQVYYFSLTETPTFLYTLDGMDGVKVEKLEVLIDVYYVNQCRAYALNAEKHEWEEISLNTAIPNPERYLDGEGRLYLQFRSDSQDMYADIPLPLINLEGRLEHAED